MTTNMREALSQARRSPLRRVHNVEHGKPSWPAPSASLRALEARGFLVYNERKTKRGERLEEWQITDAGREALLPKEVVKEDRPVYLAKWLGEDPPNHEDEKGIRELGYTLDASKRIDHLPLMDPDLVSLRWKRDGRVRLAGLEDRRQRARRLARAARRAA